MVALLQGGNPGQPGLRALPQVADRKSHRPGPGSRARKDLIKPGGPAIKLGPCSWWWTRGKVEGAGAPIDGQPEKLVRLWSGNYSPGRWRESCPIRSGRQKKKTSALNWDLERPAKAAVRPTEAVRGEDRPADGRGRTIGTFRGGRVWTPGTP